MKGNYCVDTVDFRNSFYNDFKILYDEGYLDWKINKAKNKKNNKPIPKVSVSSSAGKSTPILNKALRTAAVDYSKENGVKKKKTVYKSDSPLGINFDLQLKSIVESSVSIQRSTPIGDFSASYGFFSKSLRYESKEKVVVRINIKMYGKWEMISLVFTLSQEEIRIKMMMNIHMIMIDLQ